jgi:hypothetical protein
VNVHVGTGAPGPERLLAPEHIRFMARTPFYAARGARAQVLARVPLKSALRDRPPIFIIGCGRSGTTLLGDLFAAHPAVRYRYEPYHRWAAVDPVTDFLQLYSRGEHHCLLGADSVTTTARRRFRRLMSAPPGLTFVEKSPINALRIGYLDAVAPEARFVHIVRDGIDVTRSIERMAAVTRRMAFRPPLNEWWGVGEAKWTALVRDGRAAGYYPDEVGQLTTDAQRGAYEWLLSLREVDGWRARLESRFIELRYQDLTNDPGTTLLRVMDAVELPCPDSWLERATARVSKAGNSAGKGLALPDQMCDDFNGFQAGFGFRGRATVRHHSDPSDGSSRPGQPSGGASSPTR